MFVCVFMLMRGNVFWPLDSDGCLEDPSPKDKQASLSLQAQKISLGTEESICHWNQPDLIAKQHLTAFPYMTIYTFFSIFMLHAFLSQTFFLLILQTAGHLKAKFYCV